MPTSDRGSTHEKRRLLVVLLLCPLDTGVPGLRRLAAQEIEPIAVGVGLAGFVAIIADGKQVLVGGQGAPNSVAAFDRATGKRLLQWTTHEGGMSTFVPSPRRDLLVTSGLGAAATGFGPGETKVWDVRTGRLKLKLSYRGDVAFSADGRQIFCSNDGRFFLVETGVEAGRVGGFPVFDYVAWASNGNTVASAGRDEGIVLWDAATRQELRRCEGESSNLRELAFSADSKTLVGRTTESILAWAAATGRRRWTVASKDDALCMAVSPQGSLVACGGAGKAVVFYSLETGREVRRLKGHLEPVVSLAFSPDGSLLASQDADGIVQFWNALETKHLKND